MKIGDIVKPNHHFHWDDFIIVTDDDGQPLQSQMFRVDDADDGLLLSELTSGRKVRGHKWNGYYMRWATDVFDPVSKFELAAIEAINNNNEKEV